MIASRSARLGTLLLVLVALSSIAGCLDEARPGDELDSDTLSADLSVQAVPDRCRVTSATCGGATFTCSGMFRGERVFDMLSSTPRVEVGDSSTVSFRMTPAWSGRFMTFICPAGVSPPTGAGPTQCSVEIDEVELPSGCDFDTFWSREESVAIPSNGSASSITDVDGVRAGVRQAIVRTVVDHPDRRDLTVDLFDPTGRRFRVQDRSTRATNFFARTMMVTMPEAINGDWRVRATDGADAGTGSIGWWTIYPVITCGSPVACARGLEEYCPTDHRRTLSTPRTIGHGSVAYTFEQTIAEHTGAVNLFLDLDHPRASDLEITVRHPSGTSIRAWNRQGGTDPFTPRSLRIDDFAAKPRDGTWTVTIRDHAAAHDGVLRGFRVNGPAICTL